MWFHSIRIWRQFQCSTERPPQTEMVMKDIEQWTCSIVCSRRERVASMKILEKRKLSRFEPLTSFSTILLRLVASNHFTELSIFFFFSKWNILFRFYHIYVFATFTCSSSSSHSSTSLFSSHKMTSTFSIVRDRVQSTPYCIRFYARFLLFIFLVSSSFERFFSSHKCQSSLYSSQQRVENFHFFYWLRNGKYYIWYARWGRGEEKESDRAVVRDKQSTHLETNGIWIQFLHRCLHIIFFFTFRIPAIAHKHIHTSR